METKAHLKSWAIEIRKVFASFTSVVIRRSFSPRSIAPVNDLARLPRCASSSWDHRFFSRKARTRLPSCFLTAVVFSIHHKDHAAVNAWSTLCRRTLSHSPYCWHSLFGTLRREKRDLAIVADSDVDEKAGLVELCYESRTGQRLFTMSKSFGCRVRCNQRAGFVPSPRISRLLR